METRGQKLTRLRVGKAIRVALQEKRELTLWCVEPRGFGVRIRPSGVATYIFQYRVKGVGRTRKLSIGRSVIFSPEEARAIALGHAKSAALGEDPQGDPHGSARGPSAAASPHAAMPLDQLFDAFVEHRAERLSPKTLEGMRAHLAGPLAPLASAPIDGIRKLDVASLHAKLGATPYLANRSLATLSSLYGFAERMELLPPNSNPAKGVERYRERHRERMLAPEEIAALWKATDALAGQERHRFAAAAIQLGLLTGWRVGEVRRLRWDAVDVARLEARISGKTGERRAPLPEAAMPLMRALSETSQAFGLGEHRGVWVFPSTAGATEEVGPLSDWEHQRTWRKAVGSAALTNIRRHDLRHLIAGVIGQQTGSALRVKEAMGHRSITVSERYVAPISELQRAVADRAAAQVLALAEAGWRAAAAQGRRAT